MQLKPSGTPNNPDTLGVLGYLIVVNKQVHSYQVDALSEYLELINLDKNQTIINNIIEGKDESVSFSTSLAAFSGEPENIQRDIYYMLIVPGDEDPKGRERSRKVRWTFRQRAVRAA